MKRHDARSSLGAWYTPLELAREVAEAALSRHLAEAQDLDALLRLRVLDPACGDGVFLLAVAERLAARARALGAAELGALGACVWGVDVDPAAVRAAGARLGEAGLGATLLVADTLLDTAWGARGDTSVNVSRSFDVILGNPPWVSYAGRAAAPLAPARRDRLRARFRCFAGYPSLQGCFVERAAELLGPGGRLAFVLPASMSELDGYAPVRAALGRRCVVDTQLPDLGNLRFEGVNQPAMVLLATARTSDTADTSDASRPPAARDTSDTSRASRQPVAGDTPDTSRASRPPAARDTPDTSRAPRPPFTGDTSDTSTPPASPDTSPLPVDVSAPGPAPRWRLADPALGALEHHLLARTAALPPIPPACFAERGVQVPRALGCAQAFPGALAVLTGTEIRAWEAGRPRWFVHPSRLPPRHRQADWGAVGVYVRQTARVPIAAPGVGLAFRNSVLAGHAAGGWSALALCRYLNSTPARWLHWLRHRDARAGIPQVKVGHLRSLPDLPPAARGALEALGPGPGRAAEADAVVSEALAFDREERAALHRWWQAEGARVVPPPARSPTAPPSSATARRPGG